MKVIFLDFDGVLNSIQYDRVRRDNQGNIDETRLILLKELVEQTNAEIVLTTSWRKHWDKDKSLCDSIGEEINTVFDKYGLHIYDKTPEIDAIDRALEVNTWLNGHKNEVDAFVIFDDIAFGWGDLESHLVKTNPRIGRGLEPIHIEKAIVLLEEHIVSCIEMDILLHFKDFKDGFDEADVYERYWNKDIPRCFFVFRNIFYKCVGNQNSDDVSLPDAYVFRRIVHGLVTMLENKNLIQWVDSKYHVSASKAVLKGNINRLLACPIYCKYYNEEFKV